ncbi:uncharacterized protein LOC111262686 isoform X2 [Varroa jacobsoni]|uniref:Uncharacterized protein n=1 Tax=Varroa destructor TaxID=109461 RepID=A0A7M7MDZ3_VARDE|nr:uncharacterized protein LOC111247832 isoform X2 [Varroa destructor]XP_022692847.1 uncharacterized protein LOC111262686 isoform X2 [Varroa jacobsoni]
MSRLPAGDANAMFRKAVRRIVPRARFNGYFYLTQMIIHFIVTSAILCYTRHGVLAGDLQKHDYNICLLSESQTKVYIDCVFVNSPMTPSLRSQVNELTAKFPGINLAEITSLICKASNYDGEMVVDQFLDSFEEDVSNEAIRILQKCLPQVHSTL